MFVVAHTATGAVVAGLVPPFASGEVFERFGWIAVLAPLLLASLHPRLVLPVLRLVHRVVGRGSPPERVCGPAVLRALGGFAMAWTVGFVLLSRIMHTVSDGAWALVGISLRASQ